MIVKVFLILAINIISINLLISTVLERSFIIPMIIIGLISSIFFIIINILPLKNTYPNKRLYRLSSGCELLRLFLVSLIATIIIQISIITYLLQIQKLMTKSQLVLLGIGIIYAIICESIIFWNGILHVYFTSIQLGIKHRILGIVFGWVLGANIYYLTRIINICSDEVEFETEKIELNKVRVESEICKTVYPILMVHGVFFRDLRYFNYWGRIPKELQKNGATIYYGEQQSAGTVEACGKELSDRIKLIVEETGCEKVNIIAHSKGGLDSRVAISKYGASKYVASLTTINTPHYGCIFAEELLNKVPEKIVQFIAKKYNSTLKKLGDSSPDFIGAVMDLTHTRCLALNDSTPDSEDVLYESVVSCCNRAKSGQFPLNLSYHIVKHFDGKNDGLVSINSAKWGANFTVIEPKGKRGISHGDIIDLNRENLDSFDVREFFVNLVVSLKNRGY